MLNNSNIRIFSALLVSVLAHAALLASGIGTGQHPFAGVTRQKVRVQLVARPARVEEKRVVKQKKAEKVEKIRPLPLQQTVQVAVKEIPPVAAPLVPEMHEDVSDLNENVPMASQVGVTMARPLYKQNPPPRYPAIARRRHLEGTVVLMVSVSFVGVVERVVVRESSGYEVLDRSALRAVQDWQFEPGRRGNTPVDMDVLVPVRFAFQ